MPSTSSSDETSPLLGTDSTRTLLNPSTSAYSPFLQGRALGQAYKRWVPDPSSKEEEDRARTIIICFDGTGDQYDDDNSNVVQFVSCLKKDNQDKQLVYYQPGVGTYTESVFFTPLVSQASMVLDSMVAWNLSKHVTGGYEYLMQNYTEGDKICIFGFSRGSYTARALAGMIQKVGLLPPFNHAQVPFAWDMYTREDEDGLRASVGFKKAFCTDITIDFIGVWDTVASVGLFDKELPFVGTNSAIRVFRHAIALDEHRAKFMPNFYHFSEDATPKADADAAQQQQIQNQKQKQQQQQLHPGLPVTRQKSQDDKSLEWQAKINETSGLRTDALEVWFAGCHCDIGGGSVQNGTRNTLARIPLRWMIRQCFMTGTGIIFDGDMLKDMIGIDPDMLYPVVLPRPPRLTPTADLEITNRVKQPSPFWLFIKAVGQLLVLPITTFFHFIYKPIHHFWLLVEYTTVGKFIRGHLGIKPHNCGMRIRLPHNEDVERTPFVSEEEEELADALSPEYDQLSLAWFWWVLEGIPFRFREQKGERDDFFVRANWGNGRKIYGDAIKNGLKIHRSVKTRLEITDAKGASVYRPRAWFMNKVSVDGNAKKTFWNRVKSWFGRHVSDELWMEGPEQWNVDKPQLWQWVD